MNSPVRITTEIDSETHGLMKRVSLALGRSEAEFIAEAIQRAAETDADYLDFIQVGIDAADRGDVVPHAQVMAELDAMIEKHRVRCSP